MGRDGGGPGGWEEVQVVMAAPVVMAAVDDHGAGAGGAVVGVGLVRVVRVVRVVQVVRVVRVV